MTEAEKILGAQRPHKKTPLIEKRDFRKPAQPTGSQLKELESLTGRLSLRLQATLANYLRREIEVDPKDAEIWIFGDFASRVPDEAYVVPLVAANGDRAVLILDEDLQSHLITRFLGGGPAKPAEEEAEEEDEFDFDFPIPVEIGSVSRAALSPFIRSLLREINLLLRDERGANHYNVDLARTKLPARKHMRSSDTITVFKNRLQEDGQGGRITLAVQSRTLLHLLEIDDDEAPPEDIVVDPESAGRLEGIVRSIGMEVSVTLGHASIDLGDFIKLSKGDVLVLDRRLNEPLEVKVGNRTEFLGYPGRSGGRLAIRVTGRAPQEES